MNALLGFPDGEHRAIARDADGWFRQACVCSMGKDHALGARGSLSAARDVLSSGTLVALRPPPAVLAPIRVAPTVPEPHRRPERRRRSSDETLGLLRDRNEDRAVQAAAASVAAARRRLEAGWLPGHLEAALRLRVDHPTLTLARLADRAGLTKDAYTSRLRRGLAFPVREVA